MENQSERGKFREIIDNESWSDEAVILNAPTSLEINTSADRYVDENSGLEEERFLDGLRQVIDGIDAETSNTSEGQSKHVFGYGMDILNSMQQLALNKINGKNSHNKSSAEPHKGHGVNVIEAFPNPADFVESYEHDLLEQIKAAESKFGTVTPSLEYRKNLKTMETIAAAIYGERWVVYEKIREAAQASDELVSVSDTTQQDRAGRAEVVRSEVGEALQGRDLEAIIESLDFSPDRFAFSISNTYHGEAETFDRNTELRGRAHLGNPYYRDESGNVTDNKWGNSRDEAHFSGQPVEKVGIRKIAGFERRMEKRRVPRKGLAGKVGFKKETSVGVDVQVEPKYILDYAFSVPARGEDAVKRVGNYTGQSIQFSLELTKRQAESLSELIADDPRAVRAVLDGLVRETGDYGKWNAEIYDEDEDGNFYDPGARYGEDFQARDVRPNYEAMPSLEPQIVGLMQPTERVEDFNIPANS